MHGARCYQNANWHYYMNLLDAMKSDSTSALKNTNKNTLSANIGIDVPI